MCRQNEMLLIFSKIKSTLLSNSLELIKKNMRMLRMPHVARNVHCYNNVLIQSTTSGLKLQ